MNSQLLCSAFLPPRKRAPLTDCRGGWMGPRTSLDNVERRKVLYGTFEKYSREIS
jgi:hypothetical protein